MTWLVTINNSTADLFNTFSNQVSYVQWMEIPPPLWAVSSSEEYRDFF